MNEHGRLQMAGFALAIYKWRPTENLTDNARSLRRDEYLGRWATLDGYFWPRLEGLVVLEHHIKTGHLEIPQKQRGKSSNRHICCGSSPNA